MTCPILNPMARSPHRTGQCALAVMAKAPRAGKVKTRLSPPLTLEQSAALNICFLKDTTCNIADVALAGFSSGVVCYTPVGDEVAFNGLLPEGFALLPQRGEGFGDRLFHAAEDLFACGFFSICLIGSDSPTLPAAALQRAVKALSLPGDRIVLGGSDDGGYYLIGLKQPHARVFQQITWSTSSVYAESAGRVRELHLPLVELPLWYDVDDGATLDLLTKELLEESRPTFATENGYDARHTRTYLRELNLQYTQASGIKQRAEVEP